MEDQKFYNLTESDADKFTITLADAFLYNKDPYGFLIEDIQKRKECLNSFFKNEFSRLYKHSNIIANNQECESIIVYGNKKEMDTISYYTYSNMMNFVKLIFKGNISISETWKLAKFDDKYQNAIKNVKLPEDTLCILYFGTKSNNQGKGLGSKLLKYVIKTANNERKNIYLDNTEEKNVSYYKKFGFEVIKEIKIKEDYIVWFMLKKPDSIE